MVTRLLHPGFDLSDLMVDDLKMLLDRFHGQGIGPHGDCLGEIDISQTTNLGFGSHILVLCSGKIESLIAHEF